MIINEEGTYNLVYTATDECGNETVVNRELVVETPVYGIISRSAGSSVCERIGGSALFTEPVPQHSDGNGGWVGGSSPFDNIMPWSGMQIVEDADAGTLVSIPKFWYKWTHNGNEMQLEISPSAKNGFFVSPAHADRGDGVGERDVVYVGRYHCSSNNYKSATGVVPKSGMSRKDFRGNIHNLSPNVWQWDFATYWTIAMLYLVEFADWDSQAMIGGGCSDENQTQNTGLTDSMTYHTGTTNSQILKTAYGHIQYRYIEDLWGNIKSWCDGIYFNALEIFCIKNPSDFGDIANGTSVGTRDNSYNYSKYFTDPSSVNGFEYALYPYGSANEPQSRTHDKATATSGSNRAVHLNYGPNKSTENGVFALASSFGDTETGYGQVGSRLMKLPSA